MDKCGDRCDLWKLHDNQAEEGSRDQAEAQVTKRTRSRSGDSETRGDDENDVASEKCNTLHARVFGTKNLGPAATTSTGIEAKQNRRKANKKHEATRSADLSDTTGCDDGRPAEQFEHRNGNRAFRGHSYPPRGSL